MKGIQRPWGSSSSCPGVGLSWAPVLPRPARAASEDVAMFYYELSQYGQWVDYENYGPVWSPTNVGEDWRPYADGRWAPTDDGYVFESQEPWGWATYHYGNWMPTDRLRLGLGPGPAPGIPPRWNWRTSPEPPPDHLLHRLGPHPAARL